MIQKTVTIVGQGYVGLPLAQAAARTGWTVHGLELTELLVEALNDGTSHVDDLSDADIQEMLQLGYRATTDPRVIAESSVVVICVPTPLGNDGGPDLTAVKAASRTVGAHLRAGTTVILESTTYPGTTDGLVRSLLEAVSGLSAGRDFNLAFSPERIDPGSRRFGVKNTPKLIGGVDNDATRAAVNFYADFVDDPIPMKGAREAEMAKLLENTFRHVNIALVNEMTKFSHELGIDIWEVIRGASTKPFGFMKFTPGPGVGGHCIPIDPNYLSFEVRRKLGYPFRFVELAQEINNSMPRYVVERIAEVLNAQHKSVNGSAVLLLGVTYKANVSDQRESPAVPIAKILQDRGATLRFHDPLVERWDLPSGPISREENIDAALGKADVVVLLQDHSDYDISQMCKKARLFLDTRGIAPDPAIRL